MKNFSIRSKLIVSALGALMVSGQASAMFAPQVFENYKNTQRESLSECLSQSLAGTLQNSKMFSKFTKLPYCGWFRNLTNAENVKRIGLGAAETGLSLAALSRGKRIRTRFFGGILGIDAYNRFFSKQAEMMNKIMETRDAVKQVETKMDENSKNFDKKLDRNYAATKDNRNIIPRKVKNFFSGGRLNKEEEQEV